MIKTKHIMEVIDETGAHHPMLPKPICRAPLASLEEIFNRGIQDFMYRFHVENNVHMEFNQLEQHRGPGSFHTTYRFNFGRELYLLHPWMENGSVYI